MKYGNIDGGNTAKLTGYKINKAELVAVNSKQLNLTDFDFVPNRIKTIVFNPTGSSFGTDIVFQTDAPSGFSLYNLVTRRFETPTNNSLTITQDGVYDFFPNNDLTTIMVVQRAQGFLGDSFQRLVNGGSDLTINYNTTTAQNFVASSIEIGGANGITSQESQTGLFAGSNGGIETLFDGRVLLGACVPFTIASNNGGLQCRFFTNGSQMGGSNSYANVENTANSNRGVLHNYLVAPCTKNSTFQLQILREPGNTVTAAANVLNGARFFAIRIG